MPSPDLPPGFDFTDPDIYAERLPIEELAHMRKVAPIWWNEQEKGNLAFGDGGYWVVTKHKDVKEVSRRSDVFSSNKKTALPRYREEADPASLEAGKVVLLNQDAPHHTHLRKIISRAFTPRAIESLRHELRERAHNIAKEAAAVGSGDFVEQVSCELPLQAIAGLMGVPQEDRKKLFHMQTNLRKHQQEQTDHTENQREPDILRLAGDLTLEAVGEHEVEVAPQQRVEHVVGGDRRAGLGCEDLERRHDPRP